MRLYNLVIQLTLMQQVKEAKVKDQEGQTIRAKLAEGQVLLGLEVDLEVVLLLVEMLNVTKVCRDEVLIEFHCSRFAVQPGGNKMYKDLLR